MVNKNTIIAEFKKIPGVGVSIAHDLWDLGLRSLEDLKNAHAEQLYKDLSRLHGRKIDRCVLYVFRCAIYFVSESNHNKELLKWWNWKDTKVPK